jgi:hypothetical protein
MYAFLFIFEFILLFVLAKFLIGALSRLFLKITKSESITVTLLFYLFLPGIIVHELSHLLAAGLLFVKTGDMELTPKVTEEEVRLGSVGIKKTDFLRRAIIGVAPVLVGISIIFGILFSLQKLNATNLGIYALSFYIIFEVGNTLFSSRKDLEGIIELFLTAIFIFGALFLIRGEIAGAFFQVLQRNEIVNFFKTADLFLIVPILLDLVVVVFVKFLIGGKAY